MINFVAPRDVFNKANMTKCLGRFAQLIEQGMLPGVELNMEDELFSSVIDANTGDMVTDNLVEFDPPINSSISAAYLRRPCNSREPFPLWLTLDDESEEVKIFKSNGELSDDFIEFYEMNFRCEEHDRNVQEPTLSNNLFALAKFEKACGKLALDIHDEKHRGRGLSIDEDRYGMLGLNTQKHDGAYYVDSLITLSNGEELMLHEAGEGAMPLLIEVEDGRMIQVFNEDGSDYTPYFQGFDFKALSDDSHEHGHHIHYGR